MSHKIRISNERVCAVTGRAVMLGNLRHVAVVVGAISAIVGFAVLLPGCKRSETEKPGKPVTKSPAEGEHVHADDSTHSDGSPHSASDEAPEGDHAHDEVSLGSVTIGDMKVEVAQGHGKVESGKEGHLVVKLPYNDHGATTVRAWIGVEDRLSSLVGKGTYASSHDDYDIHAPAPSPLPENVMWWVEVEKPDGGRFVASVKPILD